MSTPFASSNPRFNAISMSAWANPCLLPTSKATVGMLEKHGLHPVFHGSDGGHVWANWRDYLHEFAPQLFK